MAMISKLALLACAAPVAAFDYGIVGAGDLDLTDLATAIPSIVTLFVGDEVLVTASGLEWEASESNGTDEYLFYETLLDGEVVASGNVSLADVGRELPTSIDVGTFKVPKGGRYTVEVVLTVDDSTASTSGEYEAYGAGVAILPLLVILILAVTTNMVEISLFTGIFVGACIIAGNINGGFKSTLDNYILNALADAGHAYVYLFSFFLSGLVGMMEKSGGMIGFTNVISQYATTPRSGKAATYAVGILVFFDDYANTLLAGQGMRPLTDALTISREKLAFLVDATAAPVASISPVSSWVGFEIGLIQTEIDRIIELEGTSDVSINTSGFAVFLQSVRYRYYPIFMLVLMATVIYSKREFGPMLVAERKTQVYKRTDGGDGGTSGSKGIGEDIHPREDQPLHAYNMFVPILLLIFLIFYLLVQTGDDGSGEQSFMDKIQASDSYSALLWATMATAMITLIFYMAQVVRDGHLIVPNAVALKEIFMPGGEDSGPKARTLMSLAECLESFLIGIARIFPATIVLTLAWASGSVMTDVGCDRLFANWIIGGLNPESLPTLSFLISLFMALATGTSWGTMSILFPLILVPTYQASGGNEQIFYSTVAGILSGSVAGDHCSPISDTTVLSALASQCGLMNHVGTQAPYVAVVVIISLLVGTVPIGYDAWPNIIGILLGFVLIGLFVFFLCKPVICPTGAWDFMTWLTMKINKDESLMKLQEDTIRAANGEDLSGAHPENGKKLDSEENSAEEVEKLKEDAIEEDLSA